MTTPSALLARMLSISPPNMGDGQPDNLSIIEEHLVGRSPVFKELHEARMAGWRSNDLEKAHKTKHKRNAALPTRSMQDSHDKACAAMTEMLRLEPRLRPAEQRPFHFLDIGAAPGGFSSALMDARGVKGTGITLPPEANGAYPLVPQSSLRYTPLLIDLFRFDLLDDPTLHPNALPLPAGHFDLVVVAARIDNDHKPEIPEAFDRLFVSQMVLSILKVSPGGTLFIRVKTPDKPCTVRLYLDLKPVCDRLSFVKATKSWGTTSWCYLVCWGMHPDGEAARALVELWRSGLRMHYRGELDGVEPDVLDDRALVDDGTVDEVAALSTQVWEAQTACLRVVGGGGNRRV